MNYFSARHIKMNPCAGLAAGRDLLHYHQWSQQRKVTSLAGDNDYLILALRRYSLIISKASLVVIILPPLAVI
jgi:hypothetical protein